MPEEKENEEFHLNMCGLKSKKQTRFHVPSKMIANVQRKKKGSHHDANRRTARFKKKRYNEPGVRIYEHYLQQVDCV